ncbi:MAG: hypothetical protein WKG52_08205 [Variovorax sp.]
MNSGNVVFGTSVVQWSDGRTSQAGDVMFAGENVPLPRAALDVLAAAEQADAATARMHRMASLFVQVLATDGASEQAPIGFVPLDDDSPGHAVALQEQAMAHWQAA